MAQFPFKGGHLIKVKITKKDKHGTAAGWPWPLNSGGHLIQVTKYSMYDRKNPDFKNWPLYTGSTVLCDRYMYESVKVRVTH